MLSQDESHHSALEIHFFLLASSSSLHMYIIHFSVFFFLTGSFIQPDELEERHINTHVSSSPGPAVPFPDGLTPALSRHCAGQRPGQQHLLKESGPEREQHGGYWC